MNEVYENCNKDDSMCGIKNCKSMTLDLGTTGMGADGKGDGTYRKITDADLENANTKLNMFNNYLIDVSGGVGGLGANIFCETENADWNDYEIDVYYKDKGLTRDPTSGTVYWINALNRQVCVRYSKNDIGLTVQRPDFDGSKAEGLFAVADGSKVTVKAKKPDEWGGSVDLKVTVDGGKYTTLETPVVTPAPTCTTDANCNAAPNPPWRYCGTKSGTTTKECMYYGYCQNHPTDTTRCKPAVTTLTCTLGSSCTDSTTPSMTYSCTNGFKVKVVKLEKDTTSGIIRLVIAVINPSNTGGPTAALQDKEEKWFKNEFLGPVMTEPSNKDAKMSVAVTDIVYDYALSKYTVTLLQGCY